MSCVCSACFWVPDCRTGIEKQPFQNLLFPCSLKKLYTQQIRVGELCHWDDAGDLGRTRCSFLSSLWYQLWQFYIQVLVSFSFWNANLVLASRIMVNTGRPSGVFFSMPRLKTLWNCFVIKFPPVRCKSHWCHLWMWSLFFSLESHSNLKRWISYLYPICFEYRMCFQ